MGGPPAGAAWASGVFLLLAGLIVVLFFTAISLASGLRLAALVGLGLCTSTSRCPALAPASLRRPRSPLDLILEEQGRPARERASPARGRATPELDLVAAGQVVLEVRSHRAAKSRS